MGFLLTIVPRYPCAVDRLSRSTLNISSWLVAKLGLVGYVSAVAILGLVGCVSAVAKLGLSAWAGGHWDQILEESLSATYIAICSHPGDKSCRDDQSCDQTICYCPGDCKSRTTPTRFATHEMTNRVAIVPFRFCRA